MDNLFSSEINGYDSEDILFTVAFTYAIARLAKVSLKELSSLVDKKTIKEYYDSSKWIKHEGFKYEVEKKVKLLDLNACGDRLTSYESMKTVLFMVDYLFNLSKNYNIDVFFVYHIVAESGYADAIVSEFELSEELDSNINEVVKNSLNQF